MIKNCQRVEITNISGNEHHLSKIMEIASNLGRSVRYLHLNFDGDIEDTRIAKKYVETFKQFENIDMLRIEALEDGNLTCILKEMMSDPHFVWFEKVRTLKCYLAKGLKDANVL